MSVCDFYNKVNRVLCFYSFRERKKDGEKDKKKKKHRYD